jgi:hypothetical protein
MRAQGIGWVRCGTGVAYGVNSITCRRLSYLTLTFSLEFPHDGDLVHLAHCYPFTYTDQQRHLGVLCKVAAGSELRCRCAC